MKTSTVKKAAEKLGGQEWIRTTEAEATGLQPVPFGHLGTCPWQRFAILLLLAPESDSPLLNNPLARALSELAVGVEPTTPGLQNRSSTVELR